MVQFKKVKEREEGIVETRRNSKACEKGRGIKRERERGGERERRKRREEKRGG